MSTRNCQHCGCNEIDTDPGRGDAVCTQCGSVLEDNIIISEIQFEENSHGGARAIGQHVTSEGQTPGLSRGYPYGTGKESQMITLQNARRRITQLSEQLRLNQQCIDLAYNIYKMVLARRLTRGRKNSHVIAACIYIACRNERTPHMLLDLSDVLQVNVYELGKTYLKFVSVLCLKFPELGN
ncbi:transcription factor IIIB 90 kDa subunit-like [Centruroides sculpturatus]|uniref:transcription factor IIIB 90 kDa subunit-like n=1 Tax=Centruroides sculpturatus TaxID=218467 RepID=UPI000C6DB0E9|nr:transcription factor IIIB 90 kDa subunit-like [Centruroides sculpturatus]